jgi:hypothetical protein
MVTCGVDVDDRALEEVIDQTQRSRRHPRGLSALADVLAQLDDLTCDLCPASLAMGAPRAPTWCGRCGALQDPARPQMCPPHRPHLI